MTEIWRDIKGYENKYQISTLGRLKSVKNDLIMRPMVATNGYLIACLWKDNRQRKFTIHKLVANTFIPNPNNLMEINHIDEDKTNNRVDNLEWCTHLYNMNYGSIRIKIGNANRGKTPSEETKRKLSLDTSQRRWINDGKNNKYINVNELEKWLTLPEWKRGKINHKIRRTKNDRKSKPMS